MSTDPNNDSQQKSAESVPEPEISSAASSPMAGPPAPPPAPDPLALGWTQLGTDESDLANRIRYPWDVVDVDKEETELIIVGTAGQKITHMGSNLLEVVNPQLQQLVLRSHLIKTMEGLQGLTSLQLLELYDNQVDALQSLESPGPSLRVLDMSYNVIRDMAPVSLCPNLTELYLANNKLKTLAGLQGLSKLQKLDLGANRIRLMDPEQLSGLVSIEELWLGKNKIEQIDGLANLHKLRRLDLQSNRLEGIENLTSQNDTLEELYLSHNAITSEGASLPTGLALALPQLTVLDLSRNRLNTTAPFAHLRSLEELWLSGNQIASFDLVQPIAQLPLETIYLEYNPVQESNPLYRKTLAQLIPSLKQIDANLIQGISMTTTTAHPQRPADITEEQRLRRLQEVIVERAKAEAESRKHGSSTSTGT